MGHLGAMLGHLGAMLSHLGVMLGDLGAMLGLCRAILGLCWAILGPSWSHVGPMLGHLGAHLGPSWGYVGARGEPPNFYFPIYVVFFEEQKNRKLRGFLGAEHRSAAGARARIAKATAFGRADRQGLLARFKRLRATAGQGPNYVGPSCGSWPMLASY